MKRFEASSSIFGALTAVLALVVPAIARDEGEKPRVIVEWGHNTPDTTYLRRNTADCERLPVDGIATWVCWPRSKHGRLAIKPVEKKFDASGRELPVYTLPSGRPVGDYQLGRRITGRDRITAEMCAAAITDLKATDFRRFNHMLINVLLANNGEPMNWFDDEQWDIIFHNIEAIARVAREGGCRGLLIDPETYGHPMWRYTDLATEKGLPRVYAKKSWPQVAGAVKRRGAQFMEAIQRGFADPTIWFCFAYCFSAAECDGDPDKLPAVGYALLPAFVDGMVEAATDGTVIIDGNELSYGHKTAEQFRKTRRLCLEDGQRISTLPERLFRDRIRCGFGLWLDHQQWDPEDLTKNRFSPAQFEASINLALEIGDGYVWIWSEVANWYADRRGWKPGDGAPVMKHPRYVPDKYRQAISHGRTRAQSPR